MKKVILLSLIILQSFFSFGQSLIYQNDTNGWITAEPNSTTDTKNVEVWGGTATVSDAAAQCANLTISDGASLQIANGETFKVGGSTFQLNTSGSVSYGGATAKLIIAGAAPSDLAKVDPSNNGGAGVLEFLTNSTSFSGNLSNSNNVTYTFTGGSNTFSGTITANVNISFSANNLVINNVVANNTATVTIPNAGINISNYTGNPGTTLFVDGSGGGGITNLTLKASATGQAILVGTGLTCTNVTSEVWVHSTTTDDGNSEAYREIGIPFAKTVSNIDWGSYNTEIKASNSYYRHGFTNSTATWANSEPDESVMGPQEVWLQGGNKITVSGGSLATRHESGYSVALANVADGNGNSGYNMVYNPSLAYFDFVSLLADNSDGRNAIINEAAWVMTQNGSVYDYVEFYGTQIDGNYIDDIGPYQAFWVEYNSGGTLNMSTSYQVGHSNGNSIDLQKKGSTTRILPDNIRIKLIADDGTNQFLDNLLLFYFDEASGTGSTIGARDVQQIKSSDATRKNPAMYMNINSEKLIYKEYLPTEITSNSFTQNFNLIGGVTQSLKLELSNNDLGDSYNIYLIDNQEGTTTKLNDGAYSFTHTALTDFPTADRFEIQITTETLGEAEKIEATNIKLANKGNSIEFLMPNTSAIDAMELVNVSGQLIKSVLTYKGQTEFDITNLSKGVYIAKLRLESGNEVSFKFIK